MSTWNGWDVTYTTQCAAAVFDQYAGTARRCKRDSRENPDATIPLCSKHREAALYQIAGWYMERLREVEKELSQHLDECDAERAVMAHMNSQMDRQISRAQQRRENALVYYMRCGAYVKIGQSMSPAGRLRQISTTGGVLSPAGLDLTTTELIATEPGGSNHERAMHAKFAHLREVGEWFREEPELTEHIRNLEAVTP